MRTKLHSGLIFSAFVALAACSPHGHEDHEAVENAAAPSASGPITPAATEAPAGAYTLDQAHASLILRVSHLGFSNYTARFKRFDAQLQFDPAQPQSSSVVVTIDPASIETDYPDPATLDFNAQLRGEQWLNTAQFPEMSFRSTEVTLTGPNTMRINGELTLRGVTRPMVLEATFNGGYAGHPMDPRARIGFSAQGSLKRSQFGMGFGVPEPGSTMGVGDEVQVLIEAEFSGPALAQASGGEAATQS